MINYNNLPEVDKKEKTTKQEVLEVGKYRIELNESQHPMLVVEDKIIASDKDEFKINSPERIVDLVNKGFRLNKLAEEQICLIAVNTKLRVLGAFTVAHGQVNQCAISPREILLRALICGASGIFIIHNHPSGEATPSDSDHNICERIKEASKLIGITLYDFLIVAGEDSYSFVKNKDM